MKQKQCAFDFYGYRLFFVVNSVESLFTELLRKIVIKFVNQIYFHVQVYFQDV